MIVRNALLFVSIPLLAHGGEGLRRALQTSPASGVLFPAIEAVVGAQALLVYLFLSIKARRRAVLPAGNPDGEGAKNAVALEFRRLMLVNLPPTAALSALETAPPLGPQPFVRSALSQVLPGITFDDQGVGVFDGRDHNILMDIGVEPQVWALTVDVTGEAAAAALRRLITQTGWRAYAPKLGRFITAEDLRT